MAAQILDLVVYPLLSLLVRAFFVSVPVFFLALVSASVSSGLSKKFRFKWLQSTVVSTYLIVFVLIFFLYWFPFVSVLPSVQTGSAPEGLQFSLLENVFHWAVIFAGLLFKALALTALLLPLEFVSALAFDVVSRRVSKTQWFCLFLAVYLTTLLALLVLLFNPWIIQGMVWFVWMT